MSRVMEEMRDEVRAEIALKMITDGKLSLEKIAQYSGLALEKIRELAEDKSANPERIMNQSPKM